MHTNETVEALTQIEYISDTLEHAVACSSFEASGDGAVIGEIITPDATGNVTPTGEDDSDNVTIYNVRLAPAQVFPVAFSSITLTGGSGWGIKI